MTERELELWTALKEAREALCGAMRVIAEIDTGTLLDTIVPGIRRKQYADRFVDEMHAINLPDGFGVRIDTVLKKYQP